MRKGFIYVQPVELIQLATRFQVAKYLEITSGEFKLGSISSYFIVGELRHWLNATMSIDNGIATITSEPINIHQYREHRSEFNKLFYDLVKEARIGLKEMRPKSWFEDQAEHYRLAAGATEGQIAIDYSNTAQHYRKIAKKL